MDQGAVATMRPGGALRAHSATDLHRAPSAGAFAGGRSGPTLRLVPGRRLGRRASLRRGGGGGMRPPAALPLFDMSVAVIDSLNLMRASMEEEMVLQSALAVPAHHALACKLEAYGIGTPFAAPRLQATVQGELSEADKSFAACLAAPPDVDFAGNTTPQFSIRRMASLGVLQHSPSLAAAAGGREAGGGGAGGAPATPSGAGRTPSNLSASASLRRGGELLRSPSVQPARSESKKRRAEPAAGGSDGRAGSGVPSDYGLIPAGSGEDAFDRPFDQLFGAPALASLFDGSCDAVAALVGAGYLLFRAAGFDGRAPAAVGGLASGLRRMSMGRRTSGAAAAAAAAVAGAAFGAEA